MLTSGSKNKSLAPYDYSSSCAFYMFAVLVVLLCQGIAGIVVSALDRAYEGASSSGTFNTACMLFFQAANAAFIYFYTRIKRQKLNFTYIKNSATGRGITPVVVIVPVILSVVLMCGMYLPTVWYGYFTQAIGIPESAGALELDNAGSVVMVVLASVLLAPLFEETIYRGVLLHGLKEEFSPVKAALLSALAFMLMHMNPLQVVFQFALGVLSAFVAFRSGRLLPSVILHAMSNLLALVIQLTPLSVALGGSVEWLTQNVAAAVFITLAFFAAAGAICFFTVKYAFDIFGRSNARASAVVGADNAVNAEKTAKAGKVEETASPEEKKSTENADNNRAQEIMREQVMAQMKKRDGLVKYFIGIGICVIMFIINLVSMLML